MTELYVFIMQETFSLLKATQKEFNLEQRPGKFLTCFYAFFFNYFHVYVCVKVTG
jgi:hypothetical protein